MNTIKKIKLALLTEKSVNVITDNYIIDENGKEHKVDDTHAMGYYNSANDRAELKNVLPVEYYNAVMAVWGEEPTIADIKEPVVKQ